MGEARGVWPQFPATLGALQNNRGPTLTMALFSGSPTIDAGSPSGCTDSLGRLLKTEQRGQHSTPFIRYAPERERC